MQTFAQYKASAVAFGSSLEDRDDWIVLLTRQRDSGLASESNFDAALKVLGGESDTLEIVRFGHWAVGWIEHIFLHPSREAEAQALEDRLEEYPLLDEDDFSEREHNAAFEAWTQYGCRDFAEAMQNEFDLMDSTRAWLEKSPDWTLHVFENNEPYALSTEGESVRVKAYGGQTLITRDQMAACLRLIRKEIRNHV